ncbi:MAG: BatA and WFA domain-containing protein [Opitutaceae bacterium]|nr:BatA and WFA domain-containing protein [Opitutaceae bacterium]
MLPVFSNPAGFWVLLGVPAVLAVHFLQQRSRRVVTSTLFLLDALAPESRGGRRWERLRGSRALWLQLLAVALAAWVLAGPRWLRDESAQTVVAVLDSSASMEAFRAEAVRAVAENFSQSAGAAARTEWVVLSSDPRQPPLYRGADRREALRAAEAWRPRMGTHDCGPALRLARSLAGGAGVTWFVTDSRAKVPPDQPAVGVGRALANAGFAGAVVSREENVRAGNTDADSAGAPPPARAGNARAGNAAAENTAAGTAADAADTAAGGGGAGEPPPPRPAAPARRGHAWRALVRNFSGEPVRREWWIEAGGARTPSQTVEIGAGGLAELRGRFPDGADALTLVLAPDGFALDDRLPLVRPAPKRLTVAVEVADRETRAFFQKIVAGVAGTERAPRGSGGLRIADWGVLQPPPPRETSGIFLMREAAETIAQREAREAAGEARQARREPVVAERHPLVADLNWQGLLGTGAGGLKREPGDEVLLWQGGEALAWLRHGAAARDAAPERENAAGREAAAGWESAAGREGAAAREGAAGGEGAAERARRTERARRDGRREGAGGGQLFLNFDWARGNAARLPAMVLLARRFTERVREHQRGAYAANFDTGAPVRVDARLHDAAGRGGAPGAGGGPGAAEGGALTVEFRPAAADGGRGGWTRAVPEGAAAVLRAPEEAGFFTVSRGGEVLVRGAAQFADTRQGDFSAAETFSENAGDLAAAARETARERNSRPDPLAPLWLLLMGAALLWSWREGGGNEGNRKESNKWQATSNRDALKINP